MKSPSSCQSLVHMRSFLETGGKILRAFVNVYLQVRLLQHLLLQLFLLLLLLPPESLLDARLQVRHIRNSLMVDFPIVRLQHVVDLLDQSLLGMRDDISRVWSIEVAIGCTVNCRVSAIIYREHSSLWRLFC